MVCPRGTRKRFWYAAVTWALGVDDRDFVKNIVDWHSGHGRTLDWARVLDRYASVYVAKPVTTHHSALLYWLQQSSPRERTDGTFLWLFMHVGCLEALALFAEYRSWQSLLATAFEQCYVSSAEYCWNMVLRCVSDHELIALFGRLVLLPRKRKGRHEELCPLTANDLAVMGKWLESKTLSWLSKKRKEM